MTNRAPLLHRRSDLLDVVADLDVDAVLRRVVRAGLSAAGAGAVVLTVGNAQAVGGFWPRLLLEGLTGEEGRRLLAELAEHGPARAATLVTTDSGRAVVRGGLEVEGELVGELVLLAPEGERFRDDQVELADLLLGVAGAALRNARTYRLSELRREWGELAARVTESIHDDFTLSDPIDAIVDGAQRLVGAVAATVVRSTSEGYDAIRSVALGDTDLTAILHQWRPQIDSAQRSGEAFEVRWGLDGTIAGFPLSSELAVEGVVLVVVPHGHGVLPEHERELLSSFTTHGSLVLDRAVLLTERHRQSVADDRTRIARDLHDVVIQRLYAAGMQLRAAVRRRTEEEAAQEVAEVAGSLDTTIRDLRATIFELERGAQASLRADLSALAREYEPALGFTPVVRTHGPLNSLVGRPLADQLTAVLREALANCARHAEATACVVEVSVDRDRIVLDVVDDGRGPGDDLAARSGLRNLQGRARGLGGGLSVESASPRGTRLHWWVPTTSH